MVEKSPSCCSRQITTTSITCTAIVALLACYITPKYSTDARWKHRLHDQPTISRPL